MQEIDLSSDDGAVSGKFKYRTKKQWKKHKIKKDQENDGRSSKMV